MDPQQSPIPLRYVPFFTTFSIGGAALVHAISRREEQPPTLLELGEAALATFFLTRVIARERVGSIVREPFVEPVEGADEEDHSGGAQRPTGSGLQRTAGELLTCTRCLGPWAAIALTVGRVVAPRHARIATRVLALAGANSFLHATHAALCSASSTPREE